MMISSNGTNINNISQGVLDKVDVVIPESNQEKIRFTKEIEVIEKKIEEINKKLLVLRKTIKEKVEKTLELRIEFEQS